MKRRHRHGWQRFKALTCKPYSHIVWLVAGDLEEYLLEKDPERYEVEMEKFWRIMND